MPEMKLAGPRYDYPISDKTLKEHLTGLQKIIKDKNLDGAILEAHQTQFDGVIRYLTDARCHEYGTTLIVPAEGNMTMINHGVMQDPAGQCNFRNVDRLIVLPYCQCFPCTDSYEGKYIARELKAMHMKRVGIVYKQCFKASTVEGLLANMDEIELVDISKEFSYLKAVKNEEEIVLAKKCVRVHEQLMDMVPAMIRPGRLENDILTEIETASRYSGCEYNGNVAVGSKANGGGIAFFRTFAAHRRIEVGDAVTVMIEVAAPGGIYGELARTFVLGEPDPDFAKVYEAARAGQQLVADSARPGITGRELDKIYSDFVAENYGFKPNGRFVGHSQGYDMMESPAICPDEDMEIRENMFLAIHPELIEMGHFAIACDNYLVGKESARRVTRTPQELTIIEY